MKDWTIYLRGRVDSEFFGFVLLDYYYKTRSRDDPETPAAFIRKVVTDYAAQTSEPVKCHRALLAACVQLLGDDFTEIISITRLFVEKHGKGLGADELEQLVAHYNDFGKALPVRAKLLSANGRPGTSGRPAGKSAEGMVMVTTRYPRAFISYCHESDEYNEWVRELAARLRDGGVESILDQWETAPGDQLPAFMEQSVRQSAFVLVVCTPKYKGKSDRRTGGVGYEGDVMTAGVFNKKFKSKKS
jgi:TIR domain-containing protein